MNSRVVSLQQHIDRVMHRCSTDAGRLSLLHVHLKEHKPPRRAASPQSASTSAEL